MLNVDTLIKKNTLKSQNLLLEFPLSLENHFSSIIFYTSFCLPSFDFPEINCLVALPFSLFIINFFFLSFTVKLVSPFTETHFKLPGYFLLLKGVLCVLCRALKAGNN